MIISYLVFIIAFILAFGLALLFLHRNKKKSNERLTRFDYCVGLFVGILVVFLIRLPLKEIVIIEDYDSGYNNPNYQLRHSEITALGNPDIKLSNGKVFNISDLQLKAGKKYLFNLSKRGMLLYPVVYGNSKGLPSSFKKAENYKAPEPIYTQSGFYNEIPNIPDYWFHEPPTSISTSGSFLDGIFGSVDVRWCLLPYDIEGDDDPSIISGE